MIRQSIPALAATVLLAACASAPAQRAMLSDEMFKRVQPGMTQDDILGMFGPPNEKMAFPMSHKVAWDYIRFDTWGYLVDFSVTFGPDGRAESRFQRRINDGGDHH